MKDARGYFQKGIIPWNKGKREIYSFDVLQKMREAKLGKHISPKTEFKIGRIPWNKGIRGVLKANKTSFMTGHQWPPEIQKKRLQHLREKVLLKPNLKMNEDLAYILGMLKGDGCVYEHSRSYRVALDITDKKIADSFMNALNNIGLHPFMSEQQPDNRIGKLKKYIVLASSTVFGIWYKSLNTETLYGLLKGEKSKIGFVRGFYEAEGCLNISNNKYRTMTLSIYNTDYQLILLVQHLINSFVFNFRLNGPYKNNNSLSKGEAKPIYRIATAIKNDVYRFLKTIKPVTKNMGCD